MISNENTNLGVAGRLRDYAMKQMLLLGMPVLLALVFTWHVYAAFHPSRAFISQSPANRWWSIDCTVGGSRDVSYDFRAHDFRVGPFQPILVGDLDWQGQYFSGDLFWSRDGTVAAASIIYYSGERQVFACAYDFREHRIIRSGSIGSLLDDSKDDTIRLLLQSRGGYDRIKLPSFKEI
jgi:hypothetical protein